MRTYIGDIIALPSHGVFVFGSNTEGRHGKGAALVAKNRFKAKYGQARGRQGNSYAIVTKDLTKSVHPSVSKNDIIEEIRDFYIYANDHPDLDFYVAYKGKGVNLNSYTPEEMAEMFALAFEEIPSNIIFEKEFSKLIKTFHI